MLIASNQSLAEFNLTKEPELISSKERLCEMYEEAEKIYKSVIEKVNTLSKFYVCFTICLPISSDLFINILYFVKCSFVS